MSQSQDTEITLGTGKMLVLFFGLVALCSVFFAVGFRMGKVAASSPLGEQVSVQASTSAGPRPSAANPPSNQTPDLTFYKSVGQDSAQTQLSPKTTKAASTSNATSADDAPRPDPMVAPLVGFFVQVAAVSKQEDAEALVDALRKKQYSASGTLMADKLYHVQIGPFGDIKDAEGMRAKLVGDGYNPILKK